MGEKQEEDDNNPEAFEARQLSGFRWWQEACQNPTAVKGWDRDHVEYGKDDINEHTVFEHSCKIHKNARKQRVVPPRAKTNQLLK